MAKSLKATFFILILFLVSLPVLFSGGSQDNTLTGTWYGGSSFPEHQGYKYQYTFTPSSPGRFMAIADGAYGPGTFGAGLQTKWTGEVKKMDSGDYEIRLISLTTGEPVEPPDELPNVLAVIGKLMVHDNGEIEIHYYWYGSYMWNRVPFIEAPDVWFLYADSPPIVEILRKMEMDNIQPDAPNM